MNEINAAPSTSLGIVGGNRNFLNGQQTVEFVAQTIPAVASQRKLKRKLNAEDESPANGEMPNLVIFQGRDESYPDELNKLILPLSCELCRTQMTSMKSAKDHYESKSHDRHISAWLAKNYTDVGLQTPPIKRLLKQGPTGPNAFHCDVCDLALTSSTHARQHYNGRKHLLVVQKGLKPSGAGYYDAAGKWVRTGTKAEPTVVDDGRFGIGGLFLKPITTTTSGSRPMAIEVLGSNGQQSEAAAVGAGEVTFSASLAAVDDSLSCKICGISVTSASQIKMHLDGIKHQKNLLKHNIHEDDATNSIPIPTSTPTSTPTQTPNVESAMSVDNNADYVMYRTPSGSYYCKLCNKAMNHISILQQHLQGKKHQKILRMQNESKATNFQKN
ncbi:zinc finger RNA-binding protein [Drosophila innubila]|uniref:zinc finger RNA-binding protein n=1 Tax=Drosophila innubila TaxID=198719 RepID=UPI00148D5289|nr:zinc finger RNA-binding protein [Drosophila innubila]